MIHDIVVNGYKPTPTKIALGTKESFGNEYLHFILDDAWDGVLVYATFHNGGSAVTVYTIDGTVKVPAEATEKPTENGIIVVCGIGEDNRIYTTNLGFRVSDHADGAGSDPVEPTPSQIEQLERLSLAAVLAAEEAADAVKNVGPAVESYVEAHKDELKGDTGTKGDPGSKGEPGKDGTNGKDGHTPVLGVDYFTASDKTEITQRVLDALPTWHGGEF